MRFWPLFYFRLALERKYISGWIYIGHLHITCTGLGIL